MLKLRPWVLFIESQKSCVLITTAMRNANLAKCRTFKC